MTGAPVLVIGAGGHAKVVIDALRLSQRTIAGLLDPALPPGTQIEGCEVLGGDDVVERSGREEVVLANGIGGTKSTEGRDAVYRLFRTKGYRFATVVHPSAVLSRSAALGEGAQVMAGCIVQPGARVGANSIVNTHASVDHDCRIGESVHIAPGVTLSGSVEIGDCSHIGTGAVVIQGVIIGRNSLVAAGAVVYRDLPENSKFIKTG